MLQSMRTYDADATGPQAAIGAVLGLVHVAYIAFFLRQFLPESFGYFRKQLKRVCAILTVIAGVRPS